jgi:hypothetical protein
MEEGGASYGEMVDDGGDESQLREEGDEYGMEYGGDDSMHYIQRGKHNGGGHHMH